LIYWIIYICRAISPANLLKYINLIEPDTDQSELHRKIYCMILAKWIGKEAYSDKDYYYTRTDIDVFKYAFQPGAKDNKPALRKLAVYQAHDSIEKIPLHIRQIVAAVRKASVR
jgi:hypothetical protein